MSAEVQIYINNLKKYLTGSDKAREMFLSGRIELEHFIEEVTKIAHKNVENGKDPQLTKEQYEDLRKSLLTYGDFTPFMELEGFPPIFLN